MRLFATDIRKDVSETLTRSVLVRELLAYAVRETWGMDCPAIVKTEAGKPYFAGEENRFFSLSHTKTHVLVGISDHELGVDIETIREGKRRERLFSPEMSRCFDYFQGWTLRESTFKLVGRGSLRSMEFSRTDDGILAPFEGVRCRLYEDVEGCMAAVACYAGEFPARIEIVPASTIRP